MFAEHGDAGVGAAAQVDTPAGAGQHQQATIGDGAVGHWQDESTAALTADDVQ
jgi:hypothetical protein